MIAKPKRVSTMVLNAGHAKAYLHPSQEWDVKFFKDDDSKVKVHYMLLSMLVDRKLFDERFELVVAAEDY